MGGRHCLPQYRSCQGPGYGTSTWGFDCWSQGEAFGQLVRAAVKKEPEEASVRSCSSFPWELLFSWGSTAGSLRATPPAMLQPDPAHGTIRSWSPPTCCADILAWFQPIPTALPGDPRDMFDPHSSHRLWSGAQQADVLDCPQPALSLGMSPMPRAGATSGCTAACPAPWMDWWDWLWCPVLLTPVGTPEQSYCSVYIFLFCFHFIDLCLYWLISNLWKVQTIYQITFSGNTD